MTYSSIAQFFQALLEEPPLGLLPGETERALIRRTGIRGAAEPPAQVRAGACACAVPLSPHKDQHDEKNHGLSRLDSRLARE